MFSHEEPGEIRRVDIQYGRTQRGGMKRGSLACELADRRSSNDKNVEGSPNNTNESTSTINMFFAARKAQISESRKSNGIDVVIIPTECELAFPHRFLQFLTSPQRCLKATRYLKCMTIFASTIRQRMKKYVSNKIFLNTAIFQC
jgi:hypothetical protein